MRRADCTVMLAGAGGVGASPRRWSRQGGLTIFEIAVELFLLLVGRDASLDGEAHLSRDEGRGVAPLVDRVDGAAEGGGVDGRMPLAEEQQSHSELEAGVYHDLVRCG